MELIAAADKNWGIGREGGLLCHLPGDLKYFKEMTTGRTVVMGRKTLDSLPGGRPLPRRRNIVLTRDPSFAREGCEVAHDLPELFSLLAGQDAGGNAGGEPVMVIGGAAVYEQLLPYCDSCLITKLEAAFAADTFIRNLDAEADFRLAWQSEPQTENGVTYRFTRYERIR